MAVLVLLCWPAGRNQGVCDVIHIQYEELTWWQDTETAVLVTLCWPAGVNEGVCIIYICIHSMRSQHGGKTRKRPY